jgi:hypothetical protein
MSCYFRQMREILREAGIEVSPGNIGRIDQAFHQIAGVPYKNCPAAWKSLKQRLATDDQRRELVRKLQDAIR